jgi:orotidine-5'-phosphate decarboxylase
MNEQADVNAAFGDRLAQAVRDKGNTVLVGLDPRAASLPAGLLSSDTKGRADIASAYEAFCRGVIDVVAPLVPAVKPQLAFFEELGPEGMAALRNVAAYARERRLLVILDGKRGDIGSTAEAYAAAYLGASSAWGGDALTVNPYLGRDTLEPFVARCRERDAGIFVLVKTSNPGSGDLQDRLVDGRPLYEAVAGAVQALSSGMRGTSGYGPVGAVVGATYPEQLTELRGLMPNAWILVPGYGSQGGTAKSVAPAFDDHGLGAIVNNSRGIIFAHQRREYEHFGAARWQAAVEAATIDMIESLAAGTSAGKLRDGR